MIVLMALVATVMNAPLVRWIYPAPATSGGEADVAGVMR
jgi:hypothetical protein